MRECFKNPPRSTREIMEPAAYLSGEKLAPLPLPDFKKDFKAYDKFDVGAVGEFDVAILIDQYAGVESFEAACIRTGAADTTTRCGRKEIVGAAGIDVSVALVESGEGFGVCVCLCEGIKEALQRVHEVEDEAKLPSLQKSQSRL